MRSDGFRVLVTGCGPIGLFCIGIAKASGASIIIASELQPARLELARILGADQLVNPASDDVQKIILERTEGLGVDVVLEMSGDPQAIRTGLKVVRDGGEVRLSVAHVRASDSAADCF